MLFQVDGVTGESLNFMEAFEMSHKFCTSLRQMGAKKGEVLALFLPNCIEFPVVFSGATAAGLAVTTMNPIYTATEIARQLTMSKPSRAVTNKALLPIIKEAISKLDHNTTVDWESRVIIIDKESGNRRIQTP
jgi:4-coumarate--CoA ligase